MSQDNLFVFEVFVRKCTISVKQAGQLSLFLRIGKTLSSFIKAKSYDDKTITFQSLIQCNCDQNALDTKRFSLTLNMKGSNKKPQVVGIIMIPLDSQINQQFKTYKISQCADSNATIELKYSIKLLHGDLNSNKKGSAEYFSTPVKSPKNLEKDQNSKIIPSADSGTVTQKKNPLSFLLFNSVNTPTSSRLPISQMAQQLQTIKPSGSNIQKKPDQQKIKLEETNKELMRENQKLRRQKAMLKELFNVESKRNKILTQYFGRTCKILSQIQNIAFKKLQRQVSDQAINKIKQDVAWMQAKLNGTQSVGQIQQVSNITDRVDIISIKGKQSLRNEKHLGSQSKISLSKISNIGVELPQLIKDSLKARQQSTITLQKLQKTIMDETGLKHQRKWRSVKIKLEKSYLELLNQPQPYTKDHIVQHKIAVNKILDELLLCKVVD